MQYSTALRKGLRDDERVAQIDLGASGLNIDFTSGTATSQAIRSGAIALRDQMRRVNNQYAEQTWYVSGEIISSTERYFSDNFQSGTIMDEILKLTGVAAIKEDSQLSGNEIVIVPLSAGVIAPIVGGLSVPLHLRVLSTTATTSGAPGVQWG